MNKRILTALLILPLLAACGSQQAWEEEQLTEASDRTMEDDVNVQWQIDSPDNPEQDELVRLKITGKNEEPINSFEITHEKLLHLIIVSEDLSYFNHIHPEFKGDGIFEIENDFPAGGEYRMIADFKPAEADSMSKMEWVQVKGEKAKPAPIEVDKKLIKTVNGNSVTLNTEQVAAGQESSLQFLILDEKTGQPIIDLEPYLGAIGHVVILSEDGENYLHVHAVEGQGTGPTALFETDFPKSGVYKVWGQFKRNGELFTVSYVINVP